MYGLTHQISLHTKFEVPSFTHSKGMTRTPTFNKCSAVAETDDHLATIDMG